MVPNWAVNIGLVGVKRKNGVRCIKRMDEDGFAAW
jgi:hypothetical protein